MSPRVSIVLPVYNGAEHLRESIGSVLAQTFGDWELIIVDDASTDDSLAVALEAAARDARIRVISNERNLRLPASLNEGFAEARGDYWTWTSHDNEYLSAALSEMVDVLDADPSCGMVYADFARVSEVGEILEEVRLQSADRLPYGNCIGACFLYRAELARQVGEYSTRLELVEDYDYWLRMASRTRLCHIPCVLYHYRVHKESLSYSKEARISLLDVRLRQSRLDPRRLEDAEGYVESLYRRLYSYRSRALRIPRLWRQMPRTFFALLVRDADREVRGLLGPLLARMRGRR